MAPDLIASNRKARRDYDITDSFEAGLVLRGSEVKSLRNGRVQIEDGFVRFDGSEAWLVGVTVSAYTQAGVHTGHDTDRPRKLLLHRRELDRLKIKVDQERLSLVPLRLYWKDGRAKVELGLGRGRKTYDKRHLLAERDAGREAQRALRRGRRRTEKAADR